MVVITVSGAYGVEPDEVLKDQALEQRARSLSAELRCLVCQNQSIDESNAPLARDLRLLVRERLKAGESDSEIRDYVVDRYGEFVLLSPRLGWQTLLLWFAPVLLLAGAFWLVRGLWRRPDVATAGGGGTPLSEAEAARVRELVGKGRRDGTEV